MTYAIMYIVIAIIVAVVDYIVIKDDKEAIEDTMVKAISHGIFWFMYVPIVLIVLAVVYILLLIGKVR